MHMSQVWGQTIKCNLARPTRITTAGLHTAPGTFLDKPRVEFVTLKFGNWKLLLEPQIYPMMKSMQTLQSRNYYINEKILHVYVCVYMHVNKDAKNDAKFYTLLGNHLE